MKEKNKNKKVWQKPEIQTLSQKRTLGGGLAAYTESTESDSGKVTVPS